ncbi:spore coat protein [Bacillus sp. MRMR6]|uniref:spore coat protein n=1 Tax=Bacillus sp. MRMR6 TaxID=1928617 RepID=UPI000952A2A7|nr:spore coat protein [Bacillus sp. MRMR6]OLS37835.1 spore coat protein [Bacillus sp. MRMR6]
MEIQDRKTLAWHETLELHELVAFQSNSLMKLKMAFKNLPDQELKEIYRKTINDLEGNLRELLKFYPSAPGYQARDYDEVREDIGFYAGDLLSLMKTMIRNLGIAITETSTPALRAVLVKQQTGAIKGQERIYNYMYKKGLYPSYDLGQLLGNDIAMAQKALNMKF